jgi:MinD-like ATPase involved in chromosome partitioning or flagellar assembly
MNPDDDFLRGDFARGDFVPGRIPPSQHQQPWTQPPQQPLRPAPYPHPAQMRPARPRPTRGWRRIVLSATLGLVNLGPSPAEREETAYEAAIRSMPNGSYKVGVLGKGGVGKTTVAASVGSVFAALRRTDHVVAVDADTAFGRLGSRIDPRATSSYWDLAAEQDMQSFADISSRVGANAAGLYVLIGEPAAGGRRILDAALYREAALRLDRHFTISIIDCGSTMDSPVTQEALRDLDALIVVSSPWADGAGAAAKTMEWLADRGQGGLLQRTVVVLNDSDGHADKRTRSALTAQFLQHGQAVVEVPFDPHLRPGGVIDVMTEMAPGTRRRFLHIAAIIARHFSARPPGRDPRAAPNQSR